MQNQEASTFVWYELHTPDAAAAGFLQPSFRLDFRECVFAGETLPNPNAAVEPVGGILPKACVAFKNDNTHPRWMGYIRVDDATRAGGGVRRAIKDISGLGRRGIVRQAAATIPNITLWGSMHRAMSRSSATSMDRARHLLEWTP